MKTYKLGRGRAIMIAEKSDNIIGDVLSLAKSGIAEIKNVTTTDNVLIRTRDKIIEYFKPFDKQGTPAIGAALLKNKMRHDDIPNRKVGGNYDAEWKRLYQFVLDCSIGIGKPQLAEIFARTVPVFTAQNHPIDYIPELLRGKIRAVPEPPSMKSNATALANAALQKTAMEQAKYEPTLQDANLSVLKPFKPMMAQALNNAGILAPSNMSELTMTFYERIVKPGTQSVYDNDYVDDAIVDAVLTFIAALQAKKLAGEPMNKTYEFIADKSLQLQDATKQAVKNQGEKEVGKFVVANALPIGLGILALLLVVGKK